MNLYYKKKHFIKQMTTSDKIWIASFDIGSVNFAFSIEEISLSKLTSITNISPNLRYNIDGTVTIAFKNILDQVYSSGKTILINNTNIRAKETGSDINTFHNLNDCLDNYKEYWDKTHYFVVEKQLEINRKARRLSLVCMSYFLYNYGRFREVIEIESKYKTMILGAKRILSKKTYRNGNKKYVSMSKYDRKKWSVQIGNNILENRNDNEGLDLFKKFKKKDDIFDTILQTQALKYLKFVDKIPF